MKIHAEVTDIQGSWTVGEGRCDKNVRCTALSILRTGTINYNSRWPCGAEFWAYQWASAPTREVEDDILVSSLIAEAAVVLEERRDDIFESPAVAFAVEGACWELMVTEVL